MMIELLDGAIRPAPGMVRGMDNGTGPRAAGGAGATETICLVSRLVAKQPPKNGNSLSLCHYATCCRTRTLFPQANERFITIND